MTDLSDDDQHADEPEGRDPVRAALREAEKRAKAAEERATQAESDAKKYLFQRAGVDPEDPRARYFVAGYGGEMTPDAIRQEAMSVGLVVPPPRTDVPPAEQQATRMFSEVAAGQQPPDSDEEYQKALEAISPKDPHAAEKVEELSRARSARLRGPF